MKLTFRLFGGNGKRPQTLAEMETYQEVIQGSIDDNKAKLAAARESAAAYHAELLANQERLDKLPKLDNVNEWIQRQQAVFTGGDYGANEQALATLLSAYATFVSNLPKMEEVRARFAVGVLTHSPSLPQHTHSPRPPIAHRHPLQLVASLASEQADITSRVDEATAALAETRTMGGQYEEQLHLNKERLEKLPKIERVEAWLRNNDAVFAGQAYGENLAETNELQAAFALFERQLPTQEQVTEATRRRQTR